MISGFATPSGTKTCLKNHPGLHYRPLGRTGLMVSQAGFGGYRVSIGIAGHENALRKALLEGINLIDTSANYADGGSEELVGAVLKSLIGSNRLTREAIVLVSKVGYLQGQNYALSRSRELEGQPFEDLVPYGDGLAHCIHPEFLEDQLSRSLKRLKVETLDVYLLHNPEYYLGWAKNNGLALADARQEYYRRLRLAFTYLEKEVARGRIRSYGISSNTFPSGSDDPQFTCLETAWQDAEAISPQHHFGVVQFPMNLLEAGALLEANQPGGRSVMRFAREKRLGVLINRPLNAIGGNRLIRLADVHPQPVLTDEEIEQRIGELIASEQALETDILSRINMSPVLHEQVKSQAAGGEVLLQQWRQFGDLDRWRQIVSAYFHPRFAGVVDFLRQQSGGDARVSQWIDTHQAALQKALQAVSTVYEAAAAEQAEKIKRVVTLADPDWGDESPLSRLAIRALRSTAGVGSVLVGMRRERYVDDVLEELAQPIEQKDRLSSWQKLRTEMGTIDFESGIA